MGTPITPPTDNSPAVVPAEASDNPPTRTRAALFAFLRLAFGIAILFYLWKSGALHFRDFDKLVAQWPLSLAAVALLLLDVLLMALRTSVLLRAQDLHLSIGTAFRLTLVSSWFGIFSPGASGGDIAKIFYATRQAAGRRAEVTAILLLDRAIGLFSLLLIPVLLAPFFLAALQEAVPLRQLLLATAIIAAVALLGFLFCLFTPGLQNDFARNNSRPASVKGWILRALASLAGYRNHVGTLLVSLLIAVIDNCLIILVAAIALLILDPSVLSAKISLVVPLGTIANSLPLTPGGLGIGEAAFNKVFVIAGLALGAETLVCTRIWKLVVAVPGLLLYLRGMRAITLGEHEPAGTSAADRERL
jgi:glycosyltransferase 2 family protein